MVTTEDAGLTPPAPVASVDPSRIAADTKNRLLSPEQGRDDYDLLEDPERTPKYGFKPDTDALPAAASAGHLAANIAERDARIETAYADPDSYRARADLAIASDEATIAGVDGITRGAHSGGAVARELQGRSSAELREMLKNEGHMQQRDPERSYTAHVGDR